MVASAQDDFFFNLLEGGDHQNSLIQASLQISDGRFLSLLTPVGIRTGGRVVGSVL